MASLRPEPGEVTIGHRKPALADFSDAELVLLASILRSGLRIRAHDPNDPDEQGHAATLTVRLRVALDSEIRTRRLDERVVAGRLVDRALEGFR